MCGPVHAARRTWGQNEVWNAAAAWNGITTDVSVSNVSVRVIGTAAFVQSDYSIIQVYMHTCVGS